MHYYKINKTEVILMRKFKSIVQIIILIFSVFTQISCEHINSADDIGVKIKYEE